MARYIDLTHPMGPDANVPAALPGPAIETVRTMASHGRNSSVITLSAHTGTHLDAPWHVLEDGERIADLPLERLITPAVVWGFPLEAPRGLGAADFEAASPGLQPGEAVLLSTGWARRYGTPAYRERPWITADGAAWLRDHGAGLVGFDFASPEQPPARHEPSFGFRIHHELLDHGVLIVENAGDMAELEGRRVRLFVIPARVEGIDGFPARVFAEV